MLSKSLKYLGLINSIIINSFLLYKNLGFKKYLKVYLIFKTLFYSFLKSILLDNYSIVYLINSKDLLKPSTFIKARFNKVIKASTSYILIASKKTCILRKILNKKEEKIIANLVLSNIAIIKGFYINIVFKAYLFNLGL
jgi:hypothetical protein